MGEQLEALTATPCPALTIPTNFTERVTIVQIKSNTREWHAKVHLICNIYDSETLNNNNNALI